MEKLGGVSLLPLSAALAKMKLTSRKRPYPSRKHFPHLPKATAAGLGHISGQNLGSGKKVDKISISCHDLRFLFNPFLLVQRSPPPAVAKMTFSTLARSQFFFSKNFSISSVSKSCGSRLLLNCTKGSSRTARNLFVPSRSPVNFKHAMGSTAGSVLSKSFSTQQSRAFSTARCLQNAVSANPAKFELAAKNVAESLQANPLVNSAKRRPINTWRPVGYWLIGMSGLVFGIVVLGGLTRLTESGLSITEWRPVTGSIPPLSQAEWEAEFEKYKGSPEFKLLNSNITLSEFKFIFFMEWAHRLVGRAIGLGIVIPAIYFVYTRKTTPHVSGRILLITALIGLQGFIGWWMVKSGLDNKFLEEPGSHPRVSQYRLTTHLFAAFLLYSVMLFTGLNILRESRWIKNPSAALKEIAMLDNPAIKRFRGFSRGLYALVFLTALSGGFVAGLDAGMIYNSFPYMGETIVPPKSELFDPAYSKREPGSKWALFWRNMLENPTTVQFNHRVLATTTFFTIVAFHLYSHRIRPFIPKPAMRANNMVVGFVSLQVTLGICTLLYVVPVSLGAAHQAGALALLTSVIIMCVRLGQPRTAQRLLLQTLAKRGPSAASNAASTVQKVYVQKPTL